MRHLQRSLVGPLRIQTVEEHVLRPSPPVATAEEAAERAERYPPDPPSRLPLPPTATLALVSGSLRLYARGGDGGHDGNEDDDELCRRLNQRLAASWAVAGASTTAQAEAAAEAHWTRRALTAQISHIEPTTVRGSAARRPRPSTYVSA